MTNMATSAGNVTPSASAAVDDRVRRPSGAAWWAGWVVSAIPILWMGVLGPVFLLMNRAMVEESMAKYGYPTSSIVPINVVAFVCVILYAVPQTAMLGAILLTGYLGGAVATHVRAGEPWFFPVIFGVLVWLGLFLRDSRVRCLAPLRKV
jgi:hypothetical protein